MRVRLLDGLDLLQVLRDRQMQRRLPCFLAGFFKAGGAQFSSFELMVLAALAFEGLGDGWSGPSSAPLSGEIPFEIIAAFGKRLPVLRSLLVARDREKFPAVADLDAFDDIDARHCFVMPPSDYDGIHRSVQTR